MGWGHLPRLLPQWGWEGGVGVGSYLMRSLRLRDAYGCLWKLRRDYAQTGVCGLSAPTHSCTNDCPRPEGSAGPLLLSLQPRASL